MDIGNCIIMNAINDKKTVLLLTLFISFKENNNEKNANIVNIYYDLIAQCAMERFNS